jgi:hypothetical protein
MIFEPNPPEPLRQFLTFEMPLEDNGWELITRGATSFWFYCLLVHEDFMGTRHEIGFCWQWQPAAGASGRWWEDDTPAYNRKT